MLEKGLNFFFVLDVLYDVMFGSNYSITYIIKVLESLVIVLYMILCFLNNVRQLRISFALLYFNHIYNIINVIFFQLYYRKSFPTMNIESAFQFARASSPYIVRFPYKLYTHKARARTMYLKHTNRGRGTHPLQLL